MVVAYDLGYRLVFHVWEGGEFMEWIFSNLAVGHLRVTGYG